MKRCALWALVASCTTLSALSPVQAGEDPGAPEAGERLIPAAEWRAMVRGRTVTYRIGTDVWAYEAYAPSGNHVSIQLADGTCMDGTWYHKDDAFCFEWLGTFTSCFQHVRTEDGILIVPIEDGSVAGTVQMVAGISDLALSCGQTLSS